MKHHRSDPKHFGLLRDLDAFRHGAHEGTDCTREAFLAELTTALCEHDSNPARIHGFRTQTMFAYVAAALDHCELIAEEDAGDFISRNANLRRPDFHIVTADGDQFLVEVKNHHKNPPSSHVRFTKDYHKTLTDYAKIVNLPLYLAVYWSQLHLWTLNRADRLIDNGTKYELSIADAIKRNDMRRLGDYTVGSIPPLSIRVSTDPSKPRKVSGDGKVAFTIGRVRLVAGENELNDELDKRIAWFLMRYGQWSHIEEPATIDEGQLLQFELQLWPEHRTEGQLFEQHGFLSQIVARQFLERVGQNRLSPDSSPRDFGIAIPHDYNSESLKLIRLIVHPTFTSIKSTNVV